MTFEDLYSAYIVARRNKRRSADSIYFELHAQRNLWQLLDDINNRTLSPTAYSFVTTKPRPREVFACEMSMRIVHHYIDLRLRPLIEARLTNRTFNNRVGFGQNAAINRVIEDIYDVSRGFTRDAWIIKMDLRGYFPNANQQIVYEQLRALVEDDYGGVDKDDLLYLIQRSIYSFPQDHCFRKGPAWNWCAIPDDKSLFKKSPGIGGAIGHLIWQNAMNYYLDDIDHWLVDTCGLHYSRFVDDMVIVTDNKAGVLALIPELRRRLAEYGCTLHPKKFYCQHYSKGVEFIGAHIKRDHVMLDARTVRNAMRAVRRLNKMAREQNVDTLLQTANSYLGICKTRNGFRVALRIIRGLHRKWGKYIYFNASRVCLEARPGYSFNERLVKQYHINPKIYERRRKERSA